MTEQHHIWCVLDSAGTIFDACLTEHVAQIKAGTYNALTNESPFRVVRARVILESEDG